MVVNLERSLKNENSELLNQHVRSNFGKFTFSQLVLSLDKIQRNDIASMLRSQVFRKVIREDIEALALTKEALLTMIATRRLSEDRDFLEHIVLYYADQHFDKMTLAEKIKVVVGITPSPHPHRSCVPCTTWASSRRPW